MYDTILVPTDGSDHAVRAAEHATSLARGFDATVHVISVVDLAREAGPFDAGGVDEAFLETLEDSSRDAIADVEALADDVEFLTDVVRGRPSEAILDYAEDHDVSLLAMGTHGRTGVQRYVAGSVTERVVRQADSPVLTTHASERSHVDDGYENVLIPTDGSEAATAAVEHGLSVAKLSGGRVHTLSVIDAGDARTLSGDTQPTELLRELESEGESATEAIADRARAAGLETATETREGSPAKTILDYADAHEIDLIAMGTQGRTGLNRYLLGSTTERIVRHAEMPVLAVSVPRANEE